MGTNEWKARAACLMGDSDVFFNEKRVEEARQICNACRVRQDCLAYAAELSPQWGMWGGATLRERRRRLPTKDYPHGRVTVDYRESDAI